MERAKANIFLLLIIWVQFGSTGFVYYENVCSGSQSTSISFNAERCCCDTKDVDCCCGTEKSCCSSSGTKDCDGFNSKCCDSHERFQQTSGDFPSAEFQLALIDIAELPALTKFVLSQNHFTQEVNDGLYPCHSPPLRHVDTRIFIQSFQI